MPSLAQRLQRAASATTAVADVPLVPLDLLRDVLADHPLVAHLGLAVDEAYAALLALHDETREEEKTEKKEEAPPPQACPHCDGVGGERLDAREGHRVCTLCGAVLTLRAVNVVREYDAPPGDEVFRDKPTRIHGVSQWVVDAAAAPRETSHWSDLEHWNQFTYLSHDTLATADRTLQRWTRGSHRREARLAAVLLLPVLRDHLPDPEGLRARLRRGEAMPVVPDPVPVARFACETCGAQRHTAKDARFHCRTSFGVKRKRRL